MRKIITFLSVIALLVSCKQEVIDKPEQLIERDVMVDIMYDLSILEATKYQNPTTLDTFKINPREYILKKYKIDSLQFAKNNVYYAADYKGYKLMFEKVTKRLDDNKTKIDSLINFEKKKKKPALPEIKKETVITNDTTKLN